MVIRTVLPPRNLRFLVGSCVMEFWRGPLADRDLVLLLIALVSVVGFLLLLFAIGFL